MTDRHIAPVHASDLRLVMTATSASEHDHHQLAYTTPFKETRVLRWLTKADAHRRAKVLKARGYRVSVSTMPV